jgi:hypothetical protein
MSPNDISDTSMECSSSPKPLLSGEHERCRRAWTSLGGNQMVTELKLGDGVLVDRCVSVPMSVVYGFHLNLCCIRENS